MNHADPVYFSVVIPVWREGAVIRERVSQVLGLESPGGCEALVVDGEPGAATLAALGDMAGGDVVAVESAKGRAAQMNAGAARARGEVLVFLHADTRLPDTGFADVARAVADGVEAGGFRLRVETGNWLLKILIRMANWRNRVLRTPYGDQAIFIRAEVFREMGGYADMPLMEDLDLMVRLRRAGRKVVVLDSEVRTSSRRWDKEGVLACSLRNIMLRMLFALGVPPGVLARFYGDHDKGGAGAGKADRAEKAENVENANKADEGEARDKGGRP